MRDYVYVADCARANVLAIEGKITEPVINVGTGVGTTTHDIARELMKLSGRDVTTESSPTRAGDLERSVLDATLTTKYLGELVALSQGLPQTARHFEL